jgi:tetratricopeptide (TPR) repeat protein
MKALLSLPALLIVLSTLAVVGASARADNAEFSQAIKMADSYALRQQSSIALGYYQQALQKAQNDGERALAQLGIARNTPVRVPGEASDQAGVKKNAEFLKVLALPEATTTAKADAQLGMAQVQAELRHFESATTLLTQIEAMPDAGADQKFKAQNWRGQILIELKQYDQAYVALTDYLANAPLDQDGKIETWRHLARIHLARNEGAKAKEVLAKTVAFPDLKDNKIADIHIANGDFLSARDFWAAARDEYVQVAVLTEADVAKSVLARFQIGQTYFREKNYAAARETWTPMIGMHGAEQHVPALWKAIGQSYEQEKEYSQARAAYEKWLAVPGLEVKNKVGAWQAIADTHVQEKNYAAAREVLGNIGQGALPGSDLYLQQQFDTAEVYRAENDFAQAAARYVDALNSVTQYYAALSDKPLVYYTVRDMVWKAVREMDKEPASQMAAYTIYEALEKNSPYEKQKADAFLGMGDILLAQGKRDEAKAKYEKALELRKNYDEGKIAAERLKVLAEKKPANE